MELLSCAKKTRNNVAFDFKIELHRTNELLERIATALERAVGPGLAADHGRVKKRGPDSIKTYGNNERLWLRENFQNLVHEQGLAPAREQELLNQAMKEYDQELEDEAVGEEEP